MMVCFETFSFRPQAVGAEAREPRALAKVVMPTGVACRAVALMRRRKASLDILAAHR